MRSSLTEQFFLKKLRIPSNWCVHRSKFYDISPSIAVQLDEKYPNENYSFEYFDEELLHIEYGDERQWTLSLVWNVGFNTEGEKYLLSLSDESWIKSNRTFDELTDEKRFIEYKDRIKLETLSLEKITDAINDIMLKISLENGDYSHYPKNLQIQEIIPNPYTRYIKNEFFDIEPSQDLSAEQWQLFQEEMLIIEHYKDSDWQVTAGWFPAFDPNGQYRIKVSLEKIDREMFEVFETRDKNEAVAYIDDVFSVHLKKLYERYNKKVKADKERARQLKLQIQRNQKI